ncbi:MAG: cobalt ECF transporter T component CbiQ [Actinomycetota bacterium]|nr:cobalt ECF transporter T component CbiQ [Actinomycetota bacterium]
MSGAHAHGLFWHGSSRVHALPPQCKIAAAGIFVLAVVLTPPQQVWVFAVYLLLLAAVIDRSRVRASFIARRMTFALPFLLFALTLPFVGGGPPLELLGVHLSLEGTWAAFSIVTKGSFGIACSILLGATTSMADLLRGFARLGLPRTLIAIAGFMIRYGDLMTGEMKRMRIARLSRGYEPSWWWESRALASSVGTLFIRAFERGERVHFAMLGRGFSGTMPDLDGIGATSRDWLGSLVVPLLAASMCALSVAVDL